MGFFYNYKIFQEIDIKDPATSETQKQEDDELDQNAQEDQNSETNDQSQSNDNTDQNDTDNQEGNEKDPEPEEGQDDNFDDYGDGEEDYNNDEGSEGGESQGASEEENNVDDIKKQEEELYANLSKDQLDIKHKELKSQFLSIFDSTTAITKRLTSINVKQEYLETVEYVANILSKLREMLTDYMNSVYKTKSYTENYVNYNRFLATLNGINKILEEIGKNED